MAQYELNLRDYTRIMRKRKLIIVFATVVIGLFSLIFSLTNQPIPLYQAISSVRVEQTTTVTGLYVETISWSDADSLETQSAIATSLPVVELAAKNMGLIDKEIPSEDIRDNPDLLNIVIDLKDNLNTLVEGETDIINISATSRTPRFSMELANAVAEAFQERNTRERNLRTYEAKDFIERRLGTIVKTLKASQQELKRLRQEKRFVSMESHARNTTRRLEDSEKRLNDARQKAKDIENLLEHLKLQKSLPRAKVVGFYSKAISPVFTTLNANLDKLQLERNVLLIDFTENHPEVKRIDTEIGAVLRNMEDHLLAEKERLRETRKESDAERAKQLQVFLSLPEISFDMERIRNDVNGYQKLLSSLEQKYQEVLIKEAEKIQEITIVRPAILPAFPVNPPTTKTTTVVGAFIGFIFGVVMAFVRETMDTSIGTIEDVEGFLGVPVVGVIPFMGTEQIKDTLLKKKSTEMSEEVLELNARLVSHFAPKSTIAESYRALRTGVEFIAAERQMKTIAIASSSMREGKTTIACNLAMASAQIGKKVLLIDTDLRKPMVNVMFGIEREPGLSDVILGNYNWDEVIKTDTDIMMGKMGMQDITTTAPGIDNLNILTSGLIPPNTSELLNSSKMSEVLSQVEGSYDIVLLDCSPVLPTTDAVIVSAKAEGVIMVYQVGQVARGALKRAKAQLENSKANVIGVVLNGLKPETGKDYKDYGYYGYYYGYGSEEEETREPWYKRWFKMPKITDKLLKIIIGDKEEEEEEGSSGISEPIYKNLIKKWYKVPDVVNNVLEKIKGSETREQPEQKSLRELRTGQERTSSLKERPWKKWLKIIILIIASTFIFYGLLWQFGILKY
jgi:capsular exopolysaccharide synthesis family protein